MFLSAIISLSAILNSILCNGVYLVGLVFMVYGLWVIITICKFEFVGVSL